MERWALGVGSFRGTPIRVHASTPLGLLVFSGFHFEPLLWACLLGLVLLHEVGHAVVVRLAGGRATEVMLTGFGGYCRWQGDVSPLGRAAIAFGGVAAQALLLVFMLALPLGGWNPVSQTEFTVYGVLTMSNAWLIALNLVPISPLDGAEAWAFPYLLGQAARRKLSSFRKVTHVGASFETEGGEGGDHERARSVAAQLLADARKDDGA